MEIKIINEKENPMFSRKEIHLEVSSNAVPSQEEARKIIVEKYSCPEEVIRIREIKGRFGVSVFSIVADIYFSKEEFNRIVKKTKQEVEAEKKAIKEAKEAKIAEAEAKKAEEEAKKAEAASKEDVPSEEDKKPVEKSKEEVKEDVAPKGVHPITEGGGK